MTLAMTNLALWCLQVSIVIAAGAAVPWLFGLVSPPVRLAYWQTLLVTCLALPLVQPYRLAPVVAPSGVSVSTGPAQVLSEGSSAQPWTAEEIVLTVLAAGATLRFLWLCGGLIRLRRLRRSGTELLPLPEEARRVMNRLGVCVDMRVSDEVTSPVTFGARNPVILLPAGFLALAPDRREPVIFHELLHVARHDWLFAIAEELLRCVLWFHPAIWWLLGRLQLTREQVVDHAVIEHTNARDEYVDALIAIAATRLEADLAPAPLFLKKRHLRQRVASISEGVSMSKKRLLLSSLAVFSALPLVVGVTAWQFPLSAAPQEVQDSPGVEVMNGAYRVLHRSPVLYPVAALGKGVSGSVVAVVSVNTKGEVMDAKVATGPEELRAAVLSSVLNWHFAAPAGSLSTFEVAVRFVPGSAPVPAKAPLRHGGAPPNVTVERMDLSALPAALRDRVTQLDMPREGELVTPERLAQFVDDLRAIDEHLTMSGPIRDGKTVFRVYLTPSGAVASPTIRVGGNKAAENLITKVTPKYPPLAKQAKVQGMVRLQATIDKEGLVKDLQVVEGHDLLVPAALEAVKQWVYRPTLLNGEPVEVMTTIDVNFTLLP